MSAAAVEPLIDPETADDAIEEAVVETPVEITSTNPSLNHKNILNLIAYVLNITLVYGIGNAGWIGTPDNGELSRKYQTLVTPASTAFAIWGLIFVSQAIFAICQLLPRFRASAMVQEGVWYWYASVAATQIGWTFTFAYELMAVSLVLILLIWLSLVTILYKQYYAKSDGTILEFWILRFPFSVHAGWITAASALNVNVLVVSLMQPAYVQLAVAIVSLAVLHAVSLWVVFFLTRPNWTIACVLAWAFGYIYVELNVNSDRVDATFEADIIIGVKYAAISVVAIIGIQMVVRLALLLHPSYNPYKKAAVVADESEEDKE